MLAAATLPVVALAAGGAGWLVVQQPWVGQPLLAAAPCIAIVARRYGPTTRAIGRLVSLPFLALLVVPVPSVAAVPATSIWWSPVVALIAIVWASAAAWAAGSGERANPVAPPAARRRRWDAPTRMAAQMAVGLGSALVVGHLLFGDRWAWTVLSAFVVASGNRGRGDVAHKAVLRVLGASVGTVVASVTASALPSGNRWLLVTLFAVMGVALYLRDRSYVFWAGGVTAMVALLHGYYGDTGTTALRERLLGVLVGAALGLAAAWFVRPVRTSDVLRRRIADCLATLTDDLAEPSGAPRTVAPLARLDELGPTLRAHDRTVGRRRRTGFAAALVAMHALASDAATALDRDRRVLRRDVVRVRRSMVGKDDPAQEELPPSLAIVAAVLHATQRRVVPSVEAS